MFNHCRCHGKGSSFSSYLRMSTGKTKPGSSIIARLLLQKVYKTTQFLLWTLGFISNDTHNIFMGLLHLIKSFTEKKTQGERLRRATDSNVCV